MPEMPTVPRPATTGARPHGAARSSARLTALLASLLLLATACGPRFDREALTITNASGDVVAQDPGLGAPTGDVVVDASGDVVVDPGTTDGTFDDGTGTATDDGTGTVDDGSGTAAPGDAGGTSDPGTSTGGGDAGTSTGGGSSSGGGTSTGGGSSTPPAQNQDPGKTTGVTKDTIKIGYLVPLTGAAPIPTSWDDGANLYWDWKADNGKTHGRSVQLIIKDTESSTSTAVAQARALVQEGVFTILTLDRLEVQDAVAKFLEQVGMPHVMVMSPANPPASWKNTFTISIDHAVQGKGVADFFANDLKAANKARKVGFVREQTNALKPGTDAFEARGAQVGLDVVVKRTFNPQDPDVTSVVLELQQSEAEIVWLYMAPTPAARIISQAGAQGYRPIWFANSVSWNFELMHGVTGGYMEGAYAFSPWVSLSNPKTAAYKKAWRDQGLDGNPDDIGLVGWGAGGVLDAALDRAGPNLGWNTFRSALRNLKVTTDVWAPLDFTATSGSVGAGTVTVYKAENGAWKTIQEGRRL